VYHEYITLKMLKQKGVMLIVKKNVSEKK